jgi:hypothetical protein
MTARLHSRIIVRTTASGSIAIENALPMGRGQPPVVWFRRYFYDEVKAGRFLKGEMTIFKLHPDSVDLAHDLLSLAGIPH